jgi:hypothetical protein
MTILAALFYGFLAIVVFLTIEVLVIEHRAGRRK